jgi:hypothetical protein
VASSTLATPGTQPSRRGGLSDHQIAGSLRSTSSVITSETTSETAAVAQLNDPADAATVIVADRAAFEPTDPPTALRFADPAAGGEPTDRPGAAMFDDPGAGEPTDPPGAAMFDDPGAGEPTDPPGSTRLIEDAETLMRSGAFRAPVPSGPAAAPTLLDSRPRQMLRGSPLSGEPTLRGVPPPPARAQTVSVRQPPPRAVAIGGLIALAVLSFLLALATRSKSPAAVVPRDATIASAAPRDARPDAPPPIDAAAIDARAPTIPIDARAPTIPIDADATTILEVRTQPDGAMVTIDGQTHPSPTQFALPAGHYAIDAELDGWMPERRTVDLVQGARVFQDIVFTARLSHDRPAQPGKLTVRTTPPCEVFLGTRRLTRTPFADLELPPGNYTLVFKHPDHDTVIKNVTITAGKPTRLSFALP